MNQRCEFYGRLADYYDRIYNYIDYASQVRWLQRVLAQYSETTRKRVLDLACGTGSHIKILRDEGFVPTGYDISRDMLRVARLKNPEVQFIRGDLRTLAVQGMYDVATCWFNSILYSEPLDVFKNTLKGIANRVVKGGLVVFDVVDKRIGINSEREHYFYEGDGLRIEFAPQWVYGEPTEGLRLSIRFKFETAGRVDEWEECHHLCALTVKEAQSALADAGCETWCLERNFGQTEIRPWNGRDQKAIIVGRKNS